MVAAGRERLAGPATQAEGLEQAGLTRAEEAAGGALSAMRAEAEELAAPAMQAASAASGAATAAVDEGSRLTAGALSAVGEAGGQVAAFLASASAATDPFSQMGELVEALEERMLVELERRGGRFAGVF
jgi:hypothetical protein